MRRGFTLIEIMLVVTIFSLVMGGVASASVVFFRMYRRAMAEAELAVDVHRIREHLLFKISPENSCSVGLLGLNVADDGIDARSITAKNESLTLGGNAGDERSYSLAWNEGCLSVDGVVGSRDWLTPDGFKPCGDWKDIVFPVSDKTVFSRDRKLYFDISLSHNGVMRGERIVIPRFGKILNPPKGESNGIEKP